MLKGISPLLGPDLLTTLWRMGHGDQLVLADAHFPAETVGRRVIRADGISIVALLDAILPLFELDSYVETPLAMMAAVEGDELDPAVAASYREVLNRRAPGTPQAQRIERMLFYEHAKQAFAVVASGDVAKYGNLILTKGVTPIEG